MAKNQVFNRKDKWKETAVLCDIGRYNYFSNNSDWRFHRFHNIPDNRDSGIQADNNNLGIGINSINQ